MNTSRKRKYIPHLAEFYFKPEFDWTNDEALQLYKEKKEKFKNRVFFEDCIQGMEKLEDESIDLIIADPPFGINFSGKETIYNREKSNIISNYSEIKSDYGEFTRKWISKIPRLMKETSSAYIISGYTHLKDVLIAIDEANLHLINHIVWKYQFGVFTKRKFVTSHYHILFLAKNPRKYFFHRIEHYNPDVWDIKRTYAPNQQKNGTKLPGELVTRCIDFNSKPGDVVLDPFLGNGTTAICAKENYRHYIGFEINPAMKPLIEEKLRLVKIGESYKPYSSRLESPEELRARDDSYERAYQIYIQGEKS
ncbi:MAG: DNA-methyltransferase [Promethearchaeota archaeon]